MGPRRLPLWIALAGLAVAAAAHAQDHAKHRAAPEVLPPGYGALEFKAPAPGSYALPPLRPAADGDVLTSEGTPTTLHALFGDRVVLLSFIFTSCSDVSGCPLATAVLHRVDRRLRDEPELAGALRLVSLSFDPERDTPEVMRRYGESFSGETLDWRFVTTRSAGELAPILEAYGQSLSRDYDEEGRYLGSISHILRVFLIDRMQRIRNIYSVSFLHPDTLIGDVKTVLMEDGSAPVAGPGAAAHAAGRTELRGPGDYRQGYESPDYETRSTGLAARRGEPVDLLARARSTPLGLPPLSSPDDNPLTSEKVALGRKLFYDRRLSLNGTFSCAMCHIPEQGFGSNEMATAVGIEGRTVRRNAPTLYNVAYLPRLFHDGRETRLEHQVWGPLLAANEMGNPSIGAVVEKIRAADDYAVSRWRPSAWRSRATSARSSRAAPPSIAGATPETRRRSAPALGAASSSSSARRAASAATRWGPITPSSRMGASTTPESATRPRWASRRGRVASSWRRDATWRWTAGSSIRSRSRGRAISDSTRSPSVPAIAGSTGPRPCATWR
jgi:cytochrome c peroxidase